jgi:uncharacterized protein (DUF1330 family)
MIVQINITDPDGFARNREAVPRVVEAIRRFWQSREYAAVKALRENAAELDVWAVPSV